MDFYWTKTYFLSLIGKSYIASKCSKWDVALCLIQCLFRETKRYLIRSLISFLERLV